MAEPGCTPDSVQDLAPFRTIRVSGKSASHLSKSRPLVMRRVVPNFDELYVHKCGAHWSDFRGWS